MLKKLLLVSLILLLFSCSMDYGTEMPDEITIEVPDAVFTDFEYNVVENANVHFRISAEYCESFTSSGKMMLKSVKLLEYSPTEKNKISAEGSADSAIMFTDSENAELSGSVVFRYVNEGITIESGYLKWDGEKRKLESRAETVTKITKDDGSVLTGSGFTADGASLTFGFKNRVEGRFVSSQEGSTK